MSRKTKKQRMPFLKQAKGWFRQPTADFYHQPLLRIGAQSVEVEGCRAVVGFDENHIRLDMGGWQVSLYGDGLLLVALNQRALLIRGRILRTEFFYE